MAAVSEWIAREYFESRGFLVHQPTKYQVAARAKRAEEEFDLLVYNPNPDKGALPGHPLWAGEDLRAVERAIIGVRGWHTDRFTPSLLSVSPEIFRFVEQDVQEKAAAILGEGPFARILCLPGLPASRSLEEQSLHMIRERGVDGVLLFRTMLLEMMRTVDINKNYEKSDLLQILRLMKNYDLVKDPQLELFAGKPPRRRAP